MKTKIIAFILCFLMPLSTLANPKISSIKENQKAPYSGILLNSEAYATIDATNQSLIEKCNADKILEEKKCESDNKMLSDTCKNDKDSLVRNFKIELDVKNNEIKRLEDIKTEPPVSRGLWFGLGIAAGVLVSTAVAITIAKNL